MRRVSLATVLLGLAACGPVVTVAPAPVPAAAPAPVTSLTDQQIATACRASILETLTAPDRTTISFTRSGGTVRGQTQVTNDVGGIVVSDYTCTVNADGSVSAVLMAG